MAKLIVKRGATPRIIDSILAVEANRADAPILGGGPHRAVGPEGATRATLEVRRSNEPARRLYERFGFAFAGVRTAYYREPVEDALVLWRNRPRPGGQTGNPDSAPAG